MNTLNKFLAVTLAPAMLAAVALPGCATAPPTQEGREVLHDKAANSLNDLYSADSGLQDFVNRGYGYVIFTEVGKGGLGVGGAYGRGEVFEQGKMIGYADLSQGTVGAQIGGQSFDELVVFENKEALERFKSNKLEFAATVSAVAIKSGAAAAAKYTDGVAVFTHPRGGAMLEAAIGGQQFTFQQSDAPK